MDMNNIPSGKRDATSHLNATKIQLLELAAEIASGRITDIEAISKYIWHEVEVVELILEGDL